MEIEGLQEIEDAIKAWAEYRQKYARRFDDENGCCYQIPKPTSNIAELKAKYPRAAAYLHAKDYSNAHNVDKRIAGKNAMKKIENGEDWADAIKLMEKEWSDSCDAHFWD